MTKQGNEISLELGVALVFKLLTPSKLVYGVYTAYIVQTVACIPIYIIIWNKALWLYELYDSFGGLTFCQFCSQYQKQTISTKSKKMDKANFGFVVGSVSFLFFLVCLSGCLGYEQY